MTALRAFLAPMKNRKGWLLLGFFAMLAGSLCSIGLMAVAGWYLGSAALAGGTVLMFGVITPGLALRSLALGRTVFRYGERIWTHEATFRLLADLRVWFFRQALPLAPGKLSLFRGGDLLSRIMDDIDALDTLYLRVIAPTVMAILLGSAGVVFLSFHSLGLGLTVAVLLVIAGAALPLAMALWGRAAGREIPASKAALRILGIDTAKGLSELRLFGHKTRQREAFHTASLTLDRHQQKLHLISAIGQAAVSLCGHLALWAALLFGLLGLEQGSLSSGMAILLLLGCLALFETVAPLPLAYQAFGKTQKAAERLLDLTQTAPPVEDPAQPKPAPERFTLQMAAVSYRYPNTERRAVEDISFCLEEGEKLAILGRSGSGKSTLAALLLRFQDPENGQITLGGVPYQELRQADLQGHFAYLSQRTELLTGTVRDNLRIGRREAQDGDLWKALEQAQLTHTIRRLPQGLESWVGEGGAGLSGGERRRLGLARAFLRNAPILLLDEPTEGLDRAAEQKVLESLDRLMSGRSVIMITHRVTDLDRMDRVLVLDNGQILAQGTPEDVCAEKVLRGS